MFNIIREYFETRRNNADAMRGYARTMRQSDRKLDRRARADRRTIGRLTTSLENLGQVAVAWLKTPSTRPASTVALDLFTASLMRGVAAGSDEVAEYLLKKATLARDEENRTAGAESSNCDKPQGSRVAEIIGTIHMSHGLLCSFLVKDDEATSIAVKIREFFPQRQVTIEDVGITDKAHIIVRAASDADGKGDDVH